MREKLSAEVAQPNTNSLNWPQTDDRVERLQGIVEKLPIVVDARLPRANKKFVIKHPFPPIINRLYLGEKSMTTNVEAVSRVLDGARNSSDHRILLKDQGYYLGLR